MKYTHSQQVSYFFYLDIFLGKQNTEKQRNGRIESIWKKDMKVFVKLKQNKKKNKVNIVWYDDDDDDNQMKEWMNEQENND